MGIICDKLKNRTKHDLINAIIFLKINLHKQFIDESVLFEIFMRDIKKIE